jgi:hypothetical protein
MQAQIEKRFRERKWLEHEVDTTNIDSLFEVHEELIGTDMLEDIQADIAELEDIMGDLDYTSMARLQTQNPHMFLLMLTKIYDLLAYLANLPIRDTEGNMHVVNLYQRAMDLLVKKNTKNGEIPEWLKKV